MDQIAFWLGYWSPVLLVLWVIAAILWLLLPFAIFGIKPLLRDILKELRSRNDQTGTRPR